MELDQEVVAEESQEVKEVDVEPLIDKENNVCHSKSIKRRLEVQTGEKWITKEEQEEKKEKEENG